MQHRQTLLLITAMQTLAGKYFIAHSFDLISKPQGLKNALLGRGDDRQREAV